MGGVIAYYYAGNYIDFVTWKKECYIGPGYELISQTHVFKFLEELYSKCIPIGLVHPKGMSLEAELPITKENIRYLYDSEDTIACMPYVVAGLLFSVPIYV